MSHSPTRTLKLTMIESRQGNLGTGDGSGVKEFLNGHTYNLPYELAMSFLEGGAALRPSWMQRV